MQMQRWRKCAAAFLLSYKDTIYFFFSHTMKINKSNIPAVMGQFKRERRADKKGAVEVPGIKAYLSLFTQVFIVGWDLRGIPGVQALS